ncbi:MAG: PD-(D/E)XK nuclease family protein [Bacteroidales bacterium]
MEFLSRVARALFEREGDKIGEICFVFPNRRSSLFFQKYLGELTSKPIFSPTLYTIKDLVVSLSGMREADNLYSLFRLYDHYSKISGSGESFDEFVFWGEIILNDFNDTDKFLANPEKLFSNVKDLKEIESDYTFLSPSQLAAVRSFWEGFLPEEDSRSKARFREVWEILYPLYLSFREELFEKSMGYEGMIYRRVAEDPALLETLNSYRKVVFVGLNALNECEKRILLDIKKMGIADFYWDYCGEMVTDNDNRASAFINYNLQNFPSSMDIDFTVETKPEIEIIGVASSVIQTKIAADIVAKLGGGIESAVVLPDERLLMPMLHSIPESVQGVNVTMGYPLKGGALFSLIQSILELKREKRGFYHTKVTAILKHSYVRLISADASKSLLRKITHSNYIYVNEELFKDDPFLNKIFDVCSADTTPESICLRLIDIMDDLGSNSSIGKMDREFIYHLKWALNRIKGILIPMSTQTFGRLLLRLAAGITIPFRGEPLTGLQIMGVLETRSLDFENIVYCSMNEDIFPQKQSGNSFIPYNLRKGFQLPVKEYDDAVSAYLFYRSIYRAKKVFLIYDTRSEGLKSGEMSRFILQLIYHYNLNITPKTVSFSINTTKREEIVVQKSEEVMKLMVDKFVNDSNGALSASALNRYIGCPLSFYFAYIEGITEEDEVSEEIEANEFGSIFHDCMQKVYAPYINKVVSAGEIGKMAGRVDEIEKFADEGFSRHKNINEVSGYNLIVKKIIVKYVVHTLRHDATYAPFTYLASEKKVRRSVKTDKGLEVNIKGFIDRVDKKEYLRIIDYKTGSGELKSKDLEALFMPNADNNSKILFQLYMYSFLINLNEPLILSPFFIKTLIKKGVDEELVTWEFIKMFQERLTTLLSEIFNEEIPFTATDNMKICDKCPYSAICFKEGR